ncbi:hypothetical protein ABEB36_007077 [Hypothenemus hampei]|uniref:Uncharacterized protein n=1 Tax=Hypothenemus hampei TaxID=57062 RepID=A0ABD1ESR1_HYPHA
MNVQDVAKLEKLKKLKTLEKNLTQLLEKLNQEMNKTDIEWMHLKNLAKTRNQQPNQASVDGELNIGTHQTTKFMNDQSINETQLNLSLDVLDSFNFEEEDDE